MIVRSVEGDTISQILLVQLGRNDDEVEDALHKVNPGLSDYGPVLPSGVEIQLPVLPESKPQLKEVINVWD